MGVLYPCPDIVIMYPHTYTQTHVFMGLCASTRAPYSSRKINCLPEFSG